MIPSGTDRPGAPRPVRATVGAAAGDDADGAVSTAATNRRRGYPDIAHLPRAKVDTIALRAGISHTSYRHVVKLVRSSGNKGVLKLQGDARLRVDRGRGRPEGLLEFSVPDLLMGTNEVAAPLADVLPAAQQAWQAASELVTWDREPGEASLMRLDLVRDFVAPEAAAQHLAGLTRVAGQRAKTIAHHAPVGGGVHTVNRKTDRWMARLYIRDELPSYEPSPLNNGETVRFELQLRSRALRDSGIATPQDMDDPHLAMLLWRHFQRSRFHVPVGDPERKLREAIAEMGHLSASDRRGVMGQLQLDAIGAEFPARDKTVQKYRRLAAQLGLTPGDVLQGVISEHCPLRKLDYANAVLERLPPAA